MDWKARIVGVCCGIRIAALAVATSTASPHIAAADLTVFAAASLANAAEDIGKLYRQKTGAPVRFSFAASSTLAKQIESGAPAALFASADEQWMDYLAQRNLIIPASRRALLGNRLVLVVPASNPVTVELKPGFDLAQFLGKERTRDRRSGPRPRRQVRAGCIGQARPVGRRRATAGPRRLGAFRAGVRRAR